MSADPREPPPQPDGRTPAGERRRTPAIAVAILLTAAAAILAACGNGASGKGLLSQTRAAELKATLARVEQQVDESDCNDAATEVATLEKQITALPESVRDSVREALTASASRLASLITHRCESVAPAATAPGKAKSEEKTQKKTEGDEKTTGKAPPPSETQPPPSETQPPEEPAPNDQTQQPGQSDDSQTGGSR